jgi:transposase
VFDVEHNSDPEALRSVIHLLDAEVLRLQRRLKDTARIVAELASDDAETIQKRLELLDDELTKRREQAYAGGSERRPRGNDADVEKKQNEKVPSKKGGKRTDQTELPIEHADCRLEAADCICPCCGGDLQEWEGKADTAEVIDVTEVRYKLKTQTLHKYRCSCGHIETALGIRKLTASGRYTADFAIHVVLSRYVDLIPLDRLRKIMARAGLTITTQSLWDQVQMVTNLLAPAKSRLLELIRAGDVVLADETRWPLLGGRSGKKLVNKHDSQNWYIWAVIGSGGVVYEIQDSRSNEAGRKLLKGYKGVVAADGYVVYRSLAKEQGFVLAHDWTHVRRKFIEAENSDPALTAPFIEDIGKLFLIEREIAEAVEGLSESEARALRKQVRDEQSKPVVERIGRRAAEVRALQESPIARAIKYLENRWEGLQVFLTRPDVPITTNAIERALRGPVIGRKISLGSRSKNGIEAASVLYSLLETAKLCGVDPGAYLRMALAAALDGLPIPLPHEIA